MLTMGRYSFVSPQTIAEQKLIKYDINELLEKLSVTWYVLLLDSTDMKFHCYYKNFWTHKLNFHVIYLQISNK